MWQRFKKTMAAAAIAAMPFGTVTCNVPDSIVFYNDDYYEDDHGFFDFGIDIFDFGYSDEFIIIDAYY